MMVQRRSPAVLSALLLAGATAGAQETIDEPMGPDSYGLQLFAVDASALAVAGLGFLFSSGMSPESRDSARVGLAAIAGGIYLFGGPTVHFVHRRPGRGVGSFALRVLAPAALGGLGYAIGSRGERGENAVISALVGAGIAASLGALIAMSIDAAALGRASSDGGPTPARLLILPPRPAAREPAAVALALRF